MANNFFKQQIPPTQQMQLYLEVLKKAGHFSSIIVHDEIQFYHLKSFPHETCNDFYREGKCGQEDPCSSCPQQLSCLADPGEPITYANGDLFDSIHLGGSRQLDAIQRVGRMVRPGRSRHDPTGR